MTYVRKHVKWIVAIAALILIAHSGPSAPSSIFVPPTDAADGWKGRSAIWWMADNTNNPSAGAYRIKAQIFWQTTDPWDHKVCWENGSTADPGGDSPNAFSDGIAACHSKMGAHWWYPQRGQFLQCWVAHSTLITVKIDYCGRMVPRQFPNADPNFHTSWGFRYRLCTGLPNTPFEICSPQFKSQLEVIGSTIRIWNSAGG